MTRALVLLSICLSCCPAAVVIRMACGGSGGTDQAGRLWTPDASYSGGSAWTSPILSGQDQPYKAMRSSSSFIYAFQFLPSTYTVTLHFLEPRIDQAAGLRLLNISINGTVAVRNLDVFASAGALKPYDMTFPVVAPSGQIQITVAAAKGNAILSGIEIGMPDVLPVDLTSRVMYWTEANAFVIDGESQMCYPQTLSATVQAAKLIAEKPTNITVDVLVGSFGGWAGDASVRSIVVGNLPGLVNASKAAIETGAWKPIPADSVLCFRLTSPMNTQWVALELVLSIGPQ